MANYKFDEQMAAGMIENDRDAIFSLYLHRCLTPELMVKHIYSRDGIPPEIANHRIDAMILDRLIEPVSYGGKEEALFLTEAGVKMATSLFGERIRKLYKPGSENQTLPTARDLRMCQANINHQMHLNQFGLEFENYARGTVEYEYYDEKFMPPAADFIMPDGLISLPNRFLFLEMDMGTEGAKRLAQKWDSYRMFLNSPKAWYEKKPVTMLFLLDGVSKIAFRQKTVMRSLMTYLGSRVNGQFEAYFETPERCQEILRTRYLNASTGLRRAEDGAMRAIGEKFGFQITQPSFLSSLGFSDAYYIKRIDGRGRVRIVGKRPQEFILGLWLDQRFSTFQTIAAVSQMEAKLRKMAGREVPCVFLVNSPMWVKRIPQITKANVSEQVFFTSPERLEVNSDWHKALFQVDQLKNLNHFTDDSLSETVHELRMAKL